MRIRKEIDDLLEAIDDAANSETHWLSLEIGNDNFDLKTFLLKQLKSGNFHHELVKDDISRGFYNFSEFVFPKNFDTPIILPKPGNSWNGNEDLRIEKLEKNQVREMLVDLLTGAGKYFSKCGISEKKKPEIANKIVEDFFNVLNNEGEWEPYNIKPDFLYQVNEYYLNDFIHPGYFENIKRDLALAIKLEGEVCILLANGYL